MSTVSDSIPGGAEKNAAIVNQMGAAARAAALALAGSPGTARNAALRGMAAAIRRAAGAITGANRADLEEARSRGLSNAMLDRLALDAGRIEKMAAGLEEVAALPDPLGAVLREWTRPNGLRISKVRVPIGVIGIIYESRPNVTADASGLCLKAGNAVILRGGSEALRSNLAIAAALREGIASAGLPADGLQILPFPGRDGVRLLASCREHLDLLIPRGGKGLIEAVAEHARVPVIKHYDGICALYIHAAADAAMARDIAVNAKTQRPGVCNAIETMLVDRAAAGLLPGIADALIAKGVELRCCPESAALLAPRPVKAAAEEDFRTEFLDLILAVKIVSGLQEAVDHINAHGSKHSDAIVTSDAAAAERFLSGVDSATVYWNASTRFTDGGEFGFGAEIGISTEKLHARGPMGLEELTSYKYLLRGSGQIRS